MPTVPLPEETGRVKYDAKQYGPRNGAKHPPEEGLDSKSEGSLVLCHTTGREGGGKRRRRGRGRVEREGGKGEVGKEDRGREGRRGSGEEERLICGQTEDTRKKQ